MRVYYAQLKFLAIFWHTPTPHSAVHHNHVLSQDAMTDETADYLWTHNDSDDERSPAPPTPAIAPTTAQPPPTAPTQAQSIPAAASPPLGQPSMYDAIADSIGSPIKKLKLQHQRTRPASPAASETIPLPASSSSASQPSRDREDVDELIELLGKDLPPTEPKIEWGDSSEDFMARLDDRRREGQFASIESALDKIRRADDAKEPEEEEETGDDTWLENEVIFREVRHLLVNAPPWLHVDGFEVMGFYDAFRRGKALIIDLMSQGFQCHVGITQNLVQRWHRTDISKYDGLQVGYAHRGYCFMIPAYAAPRSRWNDGHRWQKQSSGAMERALIHEFKNHPMLLNESPGGETPTPGCPHYTYVACLAHA